MLCCAVLVLLQVLQTMVLSGNAHCPSMEYINYVKNFKLDPVYASVSYQGAKNRVAALCWILSDAWQIQRCWVLSQRDWLGGGGGVSCISLPGGLWLC